VNSGNQGKMTFGGNAACCFFSTCLKTFLTCLTVEAKGKNCVAWYIEQKKQQSK